MKFIIRWFREDWEERRWYIPLILNILSIPISIAALVILVLKLLAQ